MALSFFFVPIVRGDRLSLVFSRLPRMVRAGLALLIGKASRKTVIWITWKNVEPFWTILDQLHWKSLIEYFIQHYHEPLHKVNIIKTFLFMELINVYGLRTNSIWITGAYNSLTFQPRLSLWSPGHLHHKSSYDDGCDLGLRHLRLDSWSWLN